MPIVDTFPIFSRLRTTPQILIQIKVEKLKSFGHLSSALDKLLGQLGFYATWLSLIAYLQKQLRIFIFFYATFFFFCDYMFSYCMKPSGM